MNATVREKFDLRKYSRLVSKVAALVIETKEEFERADTPVADSRLIVRHCTGHLPRHLKFMQALMRDDTDEK